MSKDEIRVQALLLRHRANGCISAIPKWEASFNEDAKRMAIPALQARFHQLEAEAAGLEALVEQWDEFGPFFEVAAP